MKRFFSLVIVFCLVASLAFAADGTIKLKVLGRAPLTTPVANAAMAKQVVKNHAEEIRKLEDDDLFLNLLDQLDQREFKEETIPVGAVMHWMLFKDKFGTIHSLKNVEWAGERSFKAYGFEIVQSRTTYHFFVAQECGNISLYEIKRQPEKQIPAPIPQPQQPTQPAPPSQPSEPKTVPPAIVAVPQPTPIRKYHPDFKIKVGPWIPWEPMTVSTNAEDLDLQNDFKSYLPEYKQFSINEDSEYAKLYLPTKNFTYKSGDSVWLKQQRSITSSWSGIQFNVGAEVRLWKGLWFGAEYYQSRKLRINVTENGEMMLFKQVKYLGAYYEPQTNPNYYGCHPDTFVYCLRLNRYVAERQTNYTAMTREIDLTLRYYFTTDGASLSPFVGIAGQRFTEKIKDTTKTTILYPWQDKIISGPESVTIESKTNHHDLSFVAGLSAELRICKFLSIATEGSWRKFPEQSWNYISSFEPQVHAFNGSPEHDTLDWKFKPKPWRVTGSIKILF